jgi:hypothetical protein
MKVYVASSWRNPDQPAMVELLRAVGHEVYDFREPTEGNHGFSWHEIDPSVPRGAADLRLSGARIVSLLDHPAARDGFALDMGALEWCDAVVLLLPCGRSAHLEAGWAAGAGKLTIGLLSDGEPELMWRMLDHLCWHPSGAVDALRSAGEGQDASAREDSNPGDVQARRRAYQAGRSARMGGYAREVAWTDIDLAESWRGGWDQADAAIKTDPAQAAADGRVDVPAEEGEASDARA